MTPERIAEIRARAEAATPGPWIAERDCFDEEEGLVWHLFTKQDLENLWSDPIGLWAFFFEESDANAESNATFAAHARQDIPDLLVYIKELEDSWLQHENFCLGVEE